MFRKRWVIRGDVSGPPRAHIHPLPDQDRAYVQPAHAAVEFCLRLCCELTLRKKTRHVWWSLTINSRFFLCDVQVRDYSGTYTVKMVPCIPSPNEKFSIPPVCSPREPLTFDMDIRFQQVQTADISQTWDLKTCLECISASHPWTAVSDWIHKQNPHTSCKPHSVHSVFSRWATQLQQSLASTLRCSSCPRKSCGCLTDQWASEKEAIQLSLKVYKYCHLMDIGKHYTQSTFKFSLLSRL